MNRIVVDLGANEGVSPEVISDVAAKVECKVVAAHVIGAAGEAVTVELGVEPQVLAADSRHHITAEFFAEFASVDGIEIVKDGAVRGYSESGGIAFRIKRLMCSPSDFSTESEMVLQNKEAAETWIESPCQGWKVGAIAVRRWAGSANRTESECSVKFLSLRADREQERCRENTNCR